MSRHLADHRTPSGGGRMKNFLRIARAEGSMLWHSLMRMPRPMGAGNRRALEFIRIERGRNR